MKLTTRILPVAALAICATGAALAQDSQCEERGTNGMVTLVLCPQGSPVEVFQAAGSAACGERMPCGAWIWTDAADVPETAPDSHDKLTQSQVQSAKAIWINEKKQLIVLEKK
ncbi:hypothetical protein ACFO5X_21575 [Seohaeicola nanhaiensis]|uniref:Uncharacterized protein n=1 Tax=Seohaeicola nanhaiensis TaxID=1387282 RepID=A0ABV9KLV6_9RHOB